MIQALSQRMQTVRNALPARIFVALAVATLFVFGWASVIQQHDLLWQRLSVDTVERFVADQVSAPLPQLSNATILKAACARPLGWRAGLRRKWLREDLADCLSNPTDLVQGAAAQLAIGQYQGMLSSQMNAAEAWLTQYDSSAPDSRARLLAEIKALQAHTTLGKRLPSPAGDLREAWPVNLSADGVVSNLRDQVASTRAKVKALADSTLSVGDQARELGLMAAGLQLSLDYGDAPPSPQLGTARSTLADSLEWQRRARGYQERGFSLAQLKALPLGLMVSSALLMLVVAVTTRANMAALALWATATLMLGLGAAMLIDIALTGDASLRYLAVRQFLTFGLGDWWIPLGVALPAQGLGGLSGVVLWMPLVVMSGVLLMLRGLRDASGWVMAPVRGWVFMASDAHWGWSTVQALSLLTLGMALVFFLGMPAAVSELLILLGCVGVATYVARQATYANLGGGLQWYSLLAVATALVLAVGGALLRGDLGHALVALALAACFVWLFGGVWLRWSLVAAVAAGVAALAACQMAGGLVGPLAWLTPHLPAHAQDRMYAMFDPFQADASDMARIHWLIRSAGDAGWGVGYVPWQGLAPVRTQDGLPLQGPSDYVLALSSALWGQTGGLLPMLAVLVVFVGAAAIGLRTALRTAMPLAVRWLAAVGALGCVMMAVKVVLSVGGVTGVLPLTGLPVSLLGYGPVTHLAAMLYLALALGTMHVVPVVVRRGVNLHDSTTPVGAVSRRGLGLAVASVAGLAALLGLGWKHLHTGLGDKGAQHVSKARYDMAQAVAQSLAAIDALPFAAPAETDTKLGCDQLGYAVKAWNQRLAQLSRPVRVGTSGEGAVAQIAHGLQLDATRLQETVAGLHAMKCKTLARTLGQMLDTDLPRLVGQQSVLANGPSLPGSNTQAQLNVFDKPRALGARPVDYSTANAWWGRPGCLWPAEALSRLDAKQAKPATACSMIADKPSPRIAADALGREWLTDAWLQRHLGPQLAVAQRTPADTTQWNHRAVAVGPVLGLAIDPVVQKLAQRTADCATARLKGEDCADVLPRDAAWRQRQYLDDGALRAGAMGIVVAEVDSGRIVGMAGAVSDCTLDKLGRRAQADAKGNMPALTEGSPCAQLPDQRSAYLALQDPNLWMLPPGSSFKPFSLVSGIDAGLVAPGQDAYWKGILAESHERLPVQRLALGSGQRYLDVLAGVGFGQPRTELLWGGVVSKEAPTPYRARWATDAYGGTESLRPTRMSLARAEEIRHLKEQGVNVDKRFGEAETAEFVAARRLADASVGGGDIRINTVGLVDAWRALDLRARGMAEMKALHILEQPAHTQPAKSLNWMSQNAAARALGMTSGVTASAWKGTAQGSCRVVFGACPAQGLPGLSGKTGSADFLTGEDGPNVKLGMQLPAKLFGGVFSAANGKRYAIAVMALRVREVSSRTLELKSSAPAEAALTVMRQMGLPRASVAQK